MTHWLKLGMLERKVIGKLLRYFAKRHCKLSGLYVCLSLSLFVCQTYQADEDDAGARLEVLFFVFGILIN